MAEIKNPLDFSIQPLADTAEKILGSVQRSITPESPEQSALKRKAQSDFGYTYHTYPLNLGKDSRHPFYVTFYLHLQDLSKFKNTKRGSLAGTDGNKIHSTVDIHERGSTGVNRNFNTKKYIGTDIGFGRKTSRTKAAIRLYMPDTLAWSYNNSFRDVQLAGTNIGMLAAAASAGYGAGTSIKDGYERGGATQALSNLMKNNEAKGLALEFGGGALLGDQELALSSIGFARNPQIDVIYQSPELRSFNFEFFFAPRSLKEAITVQEIIQLFKFHAAPEILADGGLAGRYFVPPSEFDIKFSVDTMGKISTCVLQSITVDYAPTGAAFYADSAQAPVHTRLTLSFRELEYITKDLIQNEGY